jgi:hypothetical protein
MPGAYHGDTTEYKNGGLWANIHAKRKRIAAGSGETMRSPGSKGAPTDEALERSKNAYGGMMDNSSMGYGGDMYAYGGKIPKEVLRARAESHMSKEAADEYVNSYMDGGYMYGKGGYVVTKSNERKGKTHKVTGPDGTVKYFGDPNLKNKPKDKDAKDAFYSRHAQNLKNNPHFRAYARATWGYGGDMNEMKYGGGMCGCGKRGCKGCGGKMHKAYGGDMRKRYYNGGEFDIELNAPDIPAPYGYHYYSPINEEDYSLDANLENNYFLNANNFTTQEELDFLKAYQDAEAKTKKKDKPKDPEDPEGDTFEGKLSAGDIMGGLAQSAGDISGLAYAMKKPAPRGTVTARTLEFDPTMYDKAIAQGDLATRALSRANPNASLSAQIASSTAMRTAIANEKAAQKFRIDAANATSEAEAERYNLRAQEMDRQAEDMRQMAISTHLTNLGGTYAGMRRDKKTMAMEAQIANMLGTENYTFKRNADGSITIVPKI